MKKKIDRTGETNINNFGSKMIIKEFRKYVDVDIYFPEYNWTFKNTRCEYFKRGNIKCPYEPRVYGIGFIGEGKYNTKDNKKCYNMWNRMLNRCYNPYWCNEHPTYRDVIVTKEWHNFQVFAEWFYEHYYEIENETMELDKDTLSGSSKIYSPETCLILPHRLNVALIGEKISNKIPNYIYNKLIDYKIEDYDEKEIELKMKSIYDYINNKPKRQDPYKEIKLTLDEKYLNTWMTVKNFELLMNSFNVKTESGKPIRRKTFSKILNCNNYKIRFENKIKDGVKSGYYHISLNN